MTTRKASFSWPSYRLFPYERRLARLEVEALLRTRPVERNGIVEAELNGHDPRLLARFTYFDSASTSDGVTFRTTQAQLERSANSRARQTRQSTRYSAHGLHEYRGKFNPQVVRAIGNILGLPSGATVFDPFCGSGTTLLECMHSGWNAVGLDINPLAIAIARAKVTSMTTPLSRLKRETLELVEKAREFGATHDFGVEWNSRDIDRVLRALPSSERLPNADYVSKWFRPSVLAQVVWLLSSVESMCSPTTAAILRVTLSDCLRRVSLQDEADLRIRRRKHAPPNEPLVPLFANHAVAAVTRVETARRVLTADPPTSQVAGLGDSRRWGSISGLLKPGRHIDAVISSPPYATALPYIDTQRLSLCVLGLLDWRDLGSTERSLIGSRDLSNAARLALEERIAAAPPHLAPVARRCRELLDAVGDSDGFRRRNMPALVYRYFEDMARVLTNLHRVAGSSLSAAFVIGPNRTKLGGTTFTVDTPELLAEVAARVGWQAETPIQLETYPRYDLHRENSITAESLLILRIAS